MVYLIEPNHTTCVVGFSVEHIMNNTDVIMSKLYFIIKHMCSYNYPYFFRYLYGGYKDIKWLSSMSQ